MPGSDLPYRLACLCDLRDQDGRVLLLRRLREPNRGLCSPIGGKLDMAAGESPLQCARREILEEVGLDIPGHRLHLMGLISEAAYEGRGHWLLFLYRVLGPVRVEPRSIPEGLLEWFDPRDIDTLPLPQSDRQVIWPMIRRHEGASDRHGFFAIHIDCRDGQMTWTLDQSHPPG